MKKFLLSTILTVSFAPFIFAQDNINGLIRDETGAPLPGATIHIKGTNLSSIADANGQFNIKSPVEFPFTLVVNSVGYKPQDIEIYELTSEAIDVSLKLDNILDEIIVIGYGEQKRSDFTGSIASIPTELKAQPVSSPERLLQGSVSGVQVTQTSGQPGSGTSVRIRGGTSINAGSEPLYVIDGFPVYNSDASVDAGIVSGAKINPLSSLSPGDIESIDVLKDASATAIYGSRGANGVIIITTKKGTREGAEITFDSFYGVQTVIRQLPLLNAEQWGALKNDARLDSGKPPAFTQEELQALGKGTDWQEEAFTSAPIQNYNLSLSTGNERSHVILSGNYFKQDGVIINTGFERYSGRLNIGYDLSDKLKVGSFLTGSFVKADVAPNGVVEGLLEMSPAVPLKDEEGNYTIVSPYETAIGNPINSLVNNVNETRTTRFLLNGFGEYEIIEGLKARVLFGADIIYNKQNRYAPSIVYEGRPAGVASVGSLYSINWLNENTINYNKVFNQKHSVDLLAGYTQQKSTTEGHTSRSSNFVSDRFTYNDLGSGTVLGTPGSISSVWVLQSVLGRVNYGFDERYFLTVTVRADGSSRFGKENKWGVFPSAAIGWNIHKEGFFDVDNINVLKLRLSGGLTGNQEIPPYQSLPRLSYLRYNFNNTLVGGFAPASYGNAQLGWETTEQYNLGIDLSFFRNRVSLIADAYYKKTNDLLLEVPIPYSSGLESSFQNYGSIENKGIELALRTENLTGKFQWSTNIVFSANRNKVLSLGPGVVEFIPINPSNTARTSEIVRVGEPLGNFYMFVTDGIFQEGDDLSYSPSQNVKPGSQRYKDINGDGVVTQAGDVTIVGNSQPDFIGGITNTFRYKNFDLTVFLQGSYGNQIFSNTKALLEIGSGFTGASATLLNRWTPANTDTDVHRAIEDPSPTLSDRFVEDGSYLRLKTLTLGYNLPEKFASRLKFKRARVYVSAQNWKTWTNYTGFDPEVSTNGQDALNSGFDFGSYPGTKSFQAGVSVSF